MGLYRNVKSVLIHDFRGPKIVQTIEGMFGRLLPTDIMVKKTEKTKLKSKREQKKISCYLLSLQGNTFINKTTRKKTPKKIEKPCLKCRKKNCISCNFFFLIYGSSIVI